MPLVPTPKNCDPSVKKAIQILTQKLGLKSVPTFAGLTLSAGPLDLSGKLTVGSFASPIDVTNTREYGFELHYSGNDYNVTGIRSRAQLVTTDTTATAQGALLQAANNDGINAGVLQGALIEAIGKSDGNAATIAVMRGALVNTEWGAYDTITNLHTLHIRLHSLNNAGAGSFGTGYGIYIENEAVGGNGQVLDAGIYFKGTNLSAGNKAFTYGIDFTGATYGTADINLQKGILNLNGVQYLKLDTDDNFLAGCNSFLNDNGQYNIGIGCETGYNNDTTGVGSQGDYNVYIGYRAGYGNVGGNTGYQNVAIGFESLYANTTGFRNTAIGYRTLRVNTTGSNNFALGYEALRSNQTGGNNIAIGYQALRQVNSHTNVAIGSSVLRNTTGRDNTAIGMNAANKNTAGVQNTAIGINAMYYTQTGDENVIIGRQAGYGVVGNSYSDNVFIGSESGFSTTTGSQNIYLGYNSGYRQTINSDRLIIDNRQRADANTELTNAILYGVMAATPADQTLRINASTTVSPTLVVTGSVFPPTTLERTTTDTNTLKGAVALRITTDGVMTDGFGGGFVFQLKDDQDVDNNIAAIYGVRDGGDHLGALQFYTGGIGTDVLRIKINAAGNVGIGTETQVSLLEADGALGLAIETVTGNTTLDATHSTVLVNANGNITITLPTAASAYNSTDGIGRIYEIKKIDADADTVTIDPNSAELIDGGGTAVLTVQWEAVTIQSNGTAWYIL